MAKSTRSGFSNIRANPPAADEPQEVAVTPEPEPEPQAEPDSLDGLTVAELRDLADDQGIDIPAGAKKADIIEALNG